MGDTFSVLPSAYPHCLLKLLFENFESKTRQNSTFRKIADKNFLGGVLYPPQKHPPPHHRPASPSHHPLHHPIVPKTAEVRKITYRSSLYVLTLLFYLEFFVYVKVGI